MQGIKGTHTHAQERNSRPSNVIEKKSNKQEEIKRTQQGPEKKKNLTDLIRRNRIFSPPVTKSPSAKKKKKVAEMGSSKWIVGRGDRYTDEAGTDPDETRSPSRIQMGDSNLTQERCQMQRGVAQRGSD